MSESHPQRQRLSSEERQEEIVQQAIKLAADHNPDRITTQNLADAMGVTQGAIFRHFPTKEAIWVSVLKWVGERMAGVVAGAAREGRDPLDKLERMLVAHMEFAAAHPGVPRLLFQELQQSSDSPVKQLIRSILTSLRTRVMDLISEAKGCGQVPAGVDEGHAAVLYLGMVQGMVMQSLLFPVDLPAQARELFRLYRRAVSAPEVPR